MDVDPSALPSNHDNSVRHLVDLGYVDPELVALREAALRRELEAEFQQALKPFEQNDLVEAARRFEKLSVADPNWVAPRQLLAEVCYRLGDIRCAEQHLEWLTLHAVENPRLALIGGAIALGKRDISDAIEALKYAAHVDPELPSVHTLLGDALFRLGDLNAARKSYERAITQRPADAHAMDGLATIHLREARFEEAANAALEALEQDMQLFRAHYHLGVALFHLERLGEAVTAFETAAKINPSAAAPYRWLNHIAREHLGDAERTQHYATRGREIVRRRVQLRHAVGAPNTNS